MDVLEIFCWVSWKYSTGAQEIFGDSPGDIGWVSWRYFMDVLEIVDGYPGDIHGCPEYS